VSGRRIHPIHGTGCGIRVTHVRRCDMKHHMDGEVRWVWILTSLAILYIVGLYVIP
jgi:hypothetical protein